MEGEIYVCTSDPRVDSPTICSLLSEERSRKLPSLVHLTVGAGWASGGEQPRITFSPRLTEVDTGNRGNSCWMSGIVKCEAEAD